MTLKQHIEISVDNEFQTRYTRNLVKAFLFKKMLLNPETDEPYNNRDIGFMLEGHVDRKKVGDYLFHMKVFLGTGKNPFLLEGFEQKFDNVEKACTGYAEIVNIQRQKEAQERASKHLLNAREINIEYYLN